MLVTWQYYLSVVFDYQNVVVYLVFVLSRLRKGK
jgi:hypothetical protein